MQFSFTFQPTHGPWERVPQPVRLWNLLPVWSFHVLFHGQILHFRPSALVECVDLKDVRNKHFVASSIKDLFDNIEAHKIIDFIKETRFYKQL